MKIDRVIIAARDLRHAALVFDQQFRGEVPRKNPRAYYAAERYLDEATRALFDAVDAMGCACQNGD